MPRLRSAILAVFLFSSPASAHDAGDTAESDFYSQTPPDYAALERLQRSNVQFEQRQGQPVAPTASSGQSRKRRRPG